MQSQYPLTTHGFKTVCLFMKGPCSHLQRAHFSLALPCKWSQVLSKITGTHMGVFKHVNFCQYQTSAVSNCDKLKKHMELIESASTDEFDKQFAPSLLCAINHTPEVKPRLMTVGVVPGKGPPPEPPIDCCMSGCANCVWIVYADALKDYYSDGGNSAKLAIEQIDNPSLKMFVKLELGFL